MLITEMEEDIIIPHKKLDYTLKSAEERKKFVDELIPLLTKDQLNNKKYMEILADYIVSAMTPEEKKEKLILTDNRMITVNKRETSFQSLVDKFENGEDGL
jgi:ribosomal protein L17